MIANAPTDEQVEHMLTRWLTNATEFAVNSDQKFGMPSLSWSLNRGRRGTEGGHVMSCIEFYKPVEIRNHSRFFVLNDETTVFKARPCMLFCKPCPVPVFDRPCVQSQFGGALMVRARQLLVGVVLARKGLGVSAVENTAFNARMPMVRSLRVRVSLNGTGSDYTGV